jgi:hypothetical protein
MALIRKAEGLAMIRSGLLFAVAPSRFGWRNPAEPAQRPGFCAEQQDSALRDEKIKLLISLRNIFYLI